MKYNTYIKNIILACSVFFTCQSIVFSQLSPELKLQDDAFRYEKLYLHIDRELYSPGDDVWFRSLLVNGLNNQPISGFKNIYVQLIAEDGRIIDQRMMLSENGDSHNDFHLPRNLPSGQYTIRGYTNYLNNFGEESLFHQKIAVASSTDLPEPKSKSNEQEIMKVDFLPEGGSLVMNATNYIAFKAINEKGYGIPVSGKIVDESGNEISTFESIYKGMGTFVIMPQEGKKYKALIDGYQGFEYTFEDAQIDGVALHYRMNENNLQFILNRNIKTDKAKDLVLTVSHKDKRFLHKKFQMTDYQQLVEIPKGFFPLGISKITVFDAQYNVLAERLVFVQNSEKKKIAIISDKTKYQTKEKIELKIKSLLNPEEDRIVAGLSVAVVNEDYFSGDGRSQTIESYLLLDSELKGPLESPASFFIDEEKISADEKLDLAMMINGWRRYFWDDLKDYLSKPLPGWEDIGLTIEGEVKSVWGEKPMKKGTIELGPFSGQFLILKEPIDEFGKFSINRLFIKDSAQVMINAKNPKGKNGNVEIFINQPHSVFNSSLSFDQTRGVNGATLEIDMPEKFKRSIFYRYRAEKEFYPDEGSILLEAIEVMEKIKSSQIITAAYGFPDRSYSITDANRGDYYSILEYLELEVPGVKVIDDEEVRIGFGKIPAKIFVDGFPPNQTLDRIPMDNIIKIEIFDPSWADIPIEVNDAKGGVISIITISGTGKLNHGYVPDYKGRVIAFVRGFRQAREFYSPVYTIAELGSIDKLDQRPTLYWNPFVMPENGEANLEFYTSDMTGRYRVIVEGVSRNGSVLIETALLNVVAVD